MSCIMNLLLAAMVCVAAAQINEQGQNCLCQRVRQQLHQISDIKDIQIYQPTIYCGIVEILIINRDGFRYCLKPESKVARQLMSNILKKKRVSTTVQSTLLPQSPVSTTLTPNTALIELLQRHLQQM